MLACKYVDDVIIDPPYKITAEFIKQMNITAVVTGKKTESQLDQDRSAMEEHDEGTTLYLFLFIFFFFFLFFYLSLRYHKQCILRLLILFIYPYLT